MPHSWVNCRPPGSPFRGMLEVGSVEAQERRPTCRRRAGYNRTPTAAAGKADGSNAAGFFMPHGSEKGSPAQGSLSLSKKPRRVSRPQPRNRIQSFSAAACTSPKILLAERSVELSAFGGQPRRGAECNPFCRRRPCLLRQAEAPLHQGSLFPWPDAAALGGAGYDPARPLRPRALFS